MQIRDTGSSGEKFPSLEDQKLADLAWKRLGLEARPIGEEDLKRVKALGYGGGVLVTSHRYPRDGGEDYGNVQQNDILVGLHAWPTTSLQSIGDVLNREDLAELNPLKFYVVRAVAVTADGTRVDGGGFGAKTELKDIVITGRISLDLGDQPRQRSSATGGYSAPTPAAGAQSSSPSAYSNFGSQTVAAKEMANTAKLPAADANPYAALTATDNSPLRYDGKTFDEWRTAWKTELSTEKRLEAVKALAAFGANGYGKEAAEAIVEVAGQYDWTSLGENKAADELKNACLSAFGYPGLSIVAYRISENDALPVLLAAVDSKNMQTRLFATWVLPSFSEQNKSAADALLKLSSDSDAKVRSYAFRAASVKPQKLFDRGISVAHSSGTF